MSYCQQCSIQFFGDDHRALAGNGVHEDDCEGCGTTIVDDDGVCISPTCFRKHGATSHSVTIGVHGHVYSVEWIGDTVSRITNYDDGSEVEFDQLPDEIKELL